MLLTIGMIMKNEERFLRDCLTAIKPILDNVDSELVICDTGSIDNSIAIAKEFTDNVFEIEWHNDFGWARQQGFKRAKGEWFLVLDPDEIFENVQNIVDFFNSGEYKNYGTATVKRTEEPNVQNSTTIAKYLRLFKIIDGMHWHNEVHEYLAPYKEPTKNLNSILLHYGNTLQILEDTKKYEKYRSIILGIYQKNPKDYSNLLELAIQYSSENLEKSIEYAEIGIKLAQQEEQNQQNKQIHFMPQLYHNFALFLMSFYMSLEKYQKAIDFVNQYFDDNSESQISEIAVQLKLQQCLAFGKQSQFIQAKDAALIAYELKKRADNNELKPIYTLAKNYPVDDITYISNILEKFVLANLLADTIDWIDNFTEIPPTATVNYKIDKYICYANFAKYILELNPKMLHDLPKTLQAKYIQNPQEYNYICNIIENVLNNSK
ncbi:MAG: glycosyltransferase [Firmicutes bacterium]|nr:glycosyltransferase [Bacillota bacterium]